MKLIRTYKLLISVMALIVLFFVWYTDYQVNMVYGMIEYELMKGGK